LLPLIEETANKEIAMDIRGFGDEPEWVEELFANKVKKREGTSLGGFAQ